jgi:hypothetical protein
MAFLNEQGRPEPPLSGDETATPLGSLERTRGTALLTPPSGVGDAHPSRSRTFRVITSIGFSPPSWLRPFVQSMVDAVNTVPDPF